jgi:hypothetical protein
MLTSLKFEISCWSIKNYLMLSNHHKNIKAIITIEHIVLRYLTVSHNFDVIGIYFFIV